MKRPFLPWLLTAVFFLILGFAISAGNDFTSDARADKLWKDGSKSPASLDPNAPVRLNSFANLAKSLSPAVVFIQVERRGAPRGGFKFFGRRHHHRMPEGFQKSGMGSGFVIHEDGWVLTNNHVVERAQRILVKLSNNNSYEARVVGADPRTDVALLKIETREKLTVAPLGDSSKLEIGSWVVAIGNPFGLSHTVTAGIVSAKGRRNIHPDNRTAMGGQMYENFIQTDASINPGNSGGPLINISGEVIGINTAINAAGQGIGFAIPVNMIKTLIPQLKKGRVSRSWLGVMIQPVSPSMARNLRMKRPIGALVAEVVSDGPADKAGLEGGDIITEFNGKVIVNSSDLPWLASNAGAGTKVTLKLLRNGSKLLREVTMGAMPGDARAGAPSEKNRPDFRAEQGGLGLRVKSVSPALAARLRIRSGQGVVVSELDDSGAAAQAGVEAGDVILKVNYERVRNTTEFVRRVRAVSADNVVSLLIRRGQRKLFIAFTKP
ncbi:MAG TPA: Do family serine endopeptidase [Myxococcales bacterium]|nr:Do family serine endopeptidase [Myxococcales bacterium]